MRQTFGIVLALLLAIVLVNDVSRLAAAHFATESIAQVAADEAARAARQSRDDPNPGFSAATSAVASEEASITGYTQEDGRVHVWVEAPVQGTVLLSPIVSLWSGNEWNDPMTVTKNYGRSF